jgi:hypothetical protein
MKRARSGALTRPTTRARHIGSLRPRVGPAGCQNSATASEQRLQATPRTHRSCICSGGLPRNCNDQTPRGSSETAGPRKDQRCLRRDSCWPNAEWGPTLSIVRLLLCPTLIGRQSELDVLVGLHDVPRGSAVFVLGDAGIGKSRLVRELADRARARGSLVPAGRAVQTRPPTPYRPLAEALAVACRRDGPPGFGGGHPRAPTRPARRRHPRVPAGRMT